MSEQESNEKESSQPTGELRKFITSDPFTRFRTDTAQDAELTLKEKGMLLVLLSLPDDWEYIHKHLQTLTADGESAHRSALDGLVEKGYVRRKRRRRQDGTLGPYDYWVYDRPIAHKVKQGEEALKAGDPPSEAISDQTGFPSLENQDAYKEREDKVKSLGASAREGEQSGEKQEYGAPDWAGEVDPPEVGPGAVRWSPEMFYSAYGSRADCRRIYEDEAKQARVVWLCDNFDAGVLKQAIEATAHVKRPHRWEYLDIWLNAWCKNQSDAPRMSPGRFREQYREALDKPFPMDQTGRLRSVVLDHTPNQIARALGASHSADYPGWRYFWSALQGIAEEEAQQQQQ